MPSPFLSTHRPHGVGGASLHRGRRAGLQLADDIVQDFVASAELLFRARGSGSRVWGSFTLIGARRALPVIRGAHREDFLDAQRAGDDSGIGA